MDDCCTHDSRQTYGHERNDRTDAPKSSEGDSSVGYDGKQPPQQAYKLSKAMMLVGIPVMVDEVESVTEDTVEFFIGVPEEATRPSPTPNMEVPPH